MHARALFGRAGEDIAARLYEDMGFELVERNFRCRAGEIDLIVSRGELLVFCEVKTRRTDAYGHPAEFVDPRKQARIRRAAAEWLRLNGGARELRFDVVSVIVRPGWADVSHLPNAF